MMWIDTHRAFIASHEARSLRARYVAPVCVCVHRAAKRYDFDPPTIGCQLLLLLLLLLHSLSASTTAASIGTGMRGVAVSPLIP